MGIYKYDRKSYTKNGMTELLSKISNPHEILLGYNDDTFYTQDYTKLTNMLVTGTTGSGKTSFVLSLLTEIMSATTPYEVKFVIFDSKKVDYVYLNGNPYMQIPVLVDALKVRSTIEWLFIEAQKRLTDQFLSSKPHIFVIFDDFFELSTKVPQISESLNGLLQIGRSAKIHVVVVSSTPSSQIIWTELKANMPFKVSFRTANKHVSRMAIDDVGAELLSFPGEMIYIGQEGKIKCYSIFAEQEELNIASKSITENCIVPQEIVLRDMEETLSRIAENELKKQGLLSDSYSHGINSNVIDYLLDDAARMVIESKYASIGLLQRKLKIGFNRAENLMNMLGIIGIVDKELRNKTPSECVLMSIQEYERISPLVRNAKKEDDLKVIGEKISASRIQFIRLVDSKESMEYMEDNARTEFIERKTKPSLMRKLLDSLRY